jgi:alkylation response protein AidB-like acyl-CoA dehydrogenase
MDFALSPDQEELRKLAQKAFARDPLIEARRAGLFDVPVEMGFVDLCVVLAELGRAAHPVPLEAAFLGALAVARLGTPEQKRKYLAQGLILATQTVLRAERDGNGYRLSGILDAVPLLDEAARLMVAAQLPSGVALFLLDPKHAVRAPQLSTDELPRHQLTLDHAPVAESDLIPPTLPVEWIRQRESVALAAVELGVVEAQLKMTAEHVMRRQQFGKPIGLFQAVAQRVGDMWVDVESLRLITWRAAWLLSNDQPAAREAHAAAFFAAEVGQRVANASQHLHAGIGFDRAYPLYRYFLAAKQIELQLGGANQRLAQLGSLMAQGEDQS